MTIRRTNYREAEALETATLTLGLDVSYYEIAVRTTVGLDTLKPTKRATAEVISREVADREVADREVADREEQYALVWRGFIEVPEDGMFEFSVSSDDGSTLQIGDAIVVDSDGFHGPEVRTGMVALRSGAHPFVLRYFQGAGGASLAVRVRVNGGAWRELPRTWLQRRP